MHIRKPLSAIALLLAFAPCLLAQTKSLYDYQDLSHLFYQKQKDSLKKAWACPDLYKERATQKKYKEIWDERTEFLTHAIADDDYVHEGDLFNYIDGIINQLVAANRDVVPVKPFLLIDRSPTVNAYSPGGHILAVNLGLITFAKSREELALVIAHELSHDILNHAENAMKQRAEWLTSDDYKKSLNAVLDSKYERLSRLKKVLETYSFSRSKHQRYHESEADSLAIVLLKKSNIDFDAACFLRLDSADIQYRQPLKSPLKNYFTSYHLTVEDAWTQKRSKGLSSRNYNFRGDTTGIDDSLKTHPDCAIRYAQTLRRSTPNARQTAIPANLKDKANKMLLWNMYNNGNLTPCLYRILLEKDNGNTDSWYDFMLSNIFSGLYYSDKELHRFAAIGVIPKEYISREYYDLQTMLEQMPRESLQQYCQTLQEAGFWKTMPPAERSLKSLMYTLALDPDNSDKNKARAAKEFTTGNSASMYCEFATSFEKK